MYKKNNSHFQIPLTSHVDELPEKLQKGIKEAWSGTFYKDLFAELTRLHLRFCMQIVPQGLIFPLMSWLAWSF